MLVRIQGRLCLHGALVTQLRMLILGGQLLRRDRHRARHHLGQELEVVVSREADRQQEPLFQSELLGQGWLGQGWLGNSFYYF